MAAKKKATKTKLDVQSGQEGAENAKAATDAKKAATAEQFADADGKAQPDMTEEELEAHQAGLGVRGY